MVTVHFAFVRFQHTAALGADAITRDPARHILDIAEFARGSFYSVCDEMKEHNTLCYDSLFSSSPVSPSPSTLYLKT